MDPSVYARAHGVQSEANNVTVTRVACGEIMYRRAVDTYRRDMKYKLSCLRKEQKRLRGCMRGYRRKLRDSGQSIDGEQLTNPHGSLRKSKIPVVGRVTVDGEPCNIGVSSAPSYGVANDSYLHIKLDHARIRPNAASAPTADKQPVISGSDVNKTLSERCCNLSILQPIKTNRPAYEELSTAATGKQTKDEILDYCPRLTEDVGRTVRKGSGKIGASSRQVYVSVADSELEDDAFADVSDSSEDEDGGLDKNDPTEVVSFKNGVFVREITPLTLMKQKAAYFKSVPKEEDIDVEVSQEKHEHADDTITENQRTDEPKNLYSNSKVPNGENHTANIPPLIKSIPLQYMVAVSNQSNKKIIDGRENPDGLPQIKKRKERVGVSFNDIIKISISNNTKKLFSLVDRLAKTNGIPVTPIERPSKDRLIKKDPREQAAAVRRAQAAEKGPTPSGTTTQGSVFYAIKYGYVPDSGDAKKAPDIFHSASSDGQSWDGVLTPNRPLVSISSNHSFEKCNSPANKPINSLHPSDNTRIFPTSLSLTKSEDGRRLSCKTSEYSIGSELASYVSDQTDKQRDKRRSSILEASKFVSATRRRRNFIANHKVPEENKRERELFIRPPKDSVKREHVELSDTHKEPWASAFSRIKMVHTLVDLTHVI